MKYSVEWLKQEIAEQREPEYILFWGHQPSKSGELTATCFSQWWIAPFTIDGILYRTAEHYMMAEKAKLFGDTETWEKIIACEKPAEAKKLGRAVRGYNDELWPEHRFEIVVKGNVGKFGSDPKLKEYLLNTGDRVIVEASPVDAIWGTGHAKDHPNAERPWLWRGTNLLGFALMEVRDRLKA